MIPGHGIGSVLNQTYRLERELGRGGLGTVYAGLHLGRSIECAIRVLPEEASEWTVERERFLRDHRVAAQLADARLPGILDVAQSESGRLFIAAPLCRGETLRQRLRRGALPARSAFGLLHRLCEALLPLHERQVPHGRLHPENIVLGKDEALVLLDLGLHHFLVGPLRSFGRRAPGVGFYVPPELLDSKLAEANLQGDVFALGAILYEALVGRPAFPDPPGAGRAASGPPPGRAGIAPELGPALERLLAGACALDPAARPADVGALRAELRALEVMVLGTSATDSAQRSGAPFIEDGTSETAAAPVAEAPSRRSKRRPLLPGPEIDGDAEGRAPGVEGLQPSASLTDAAPLRAAPSTMTPKPPASSGTPPPIPATARSAAASAGSAPAASAGSTPALPSSATPSPAAAASGSRSTPAASGDPPLSPVAARLAALARGDFPGMPRPARSGAASADKGPAPSSQSLRGPLRTSVSSGRPASGATPPPPPAAAAPPAAAPSPAVAVSPVAASPAVAAPSTVSPPPAVLPAVLPAAAQVAPAVASPAAVSPALDAPAAPQALVEPESAASPVALALAPAESAATPASAAPVPVPPSLSEPISALPPTAAESPSNAARDAARALAAAKAAAAARLLEAARATARTAVPMVYGGNQAVPELAPSSASTPSTRRRRAPADLKELPPASGELVTEQRQPPTLESPQIIINLPVPAAATGVRHAPPPLPAELAQRSSPVSGAPTASGAPAASGALAASAASGGLAPLPPTMPIRTIAPTPIAAPPAELAEETPRPFGEGAPQGADSGVLRTEEVALLTSRAQSPRKLQLALVALAGLGALCYVGLRALPPAAPPPPAHPDPALVRTQILGQKLTEIDQALHAQDWRAAMLRADEGLAIQAGQAEILARRRHAESELANQMRFESFRGAIGRQNAEAAMALFAEITEDSAYRAPAREMLRDVQAQYVAAKLQQAQRARRLGLCAEVHRLAGMILTLSPGPGAVHDEAAALDANCPPGGAPAPGEARSGDPRSGEPRPPKPAEPRPPVRKAEAPRPEPRDEPGEPPASTLKELRDPFR